MVDGVSNDTHLGRSMSAGQGEPLVVPVPAPGPGPSSANQPRPSTHRRGHTRIFDSIESRRGARLDIPNLVEPDGLKQFGVPIDVAHAFVQTADAIDAVVLTRLPGPAATELIDDGHDLKSFFVHAKSCDWGPVAGFVCQLPALNKNGPDGMDFNLTEIRSSEDKLRSVKEEALGQAERKHQGDLAAILRELKTSGIAGSPYVGITISDRAWTRLYPSFLEPRYQTVTSDGRMVGIAANKHGEVVLEWVRVQVAPSPAGFTNAVYHGQIWIRDKVGYTPYLGLRSDADGERFVLNQFGGERLRVAVGEHDRLELTSEQQQAATTLRQQWATDRGVVLPSASEATWNPRSAFRLRVLQNPYLPYPDGDPRNAVTGDYDLFALWPRIRAGWWADVLRYSEWDQTAGRPYAVPHLPNVFHAVPQRRFTVTLSAAPRVHVEVIPNSPEIDNIEHPVLGNINDAVYQAGQIFNSLVTSRYARTVAVNLAFHSDEGGRPGVTEIDYTIAAFLPQSLVGDRTARALVIPGHAQFLGLIELLLDRCEIPLNHGWLIHLIADLADPAKLVPGDVALDMGSAPRFTAKRRKAHRELVEKGQLEPLRAQMARLLTGGTGGWDSAPVRDTVDAVLQVTWLQHQKAYAHMMVETLLGIKHDGADASGTVAGGVHGRGDDTERKEDRG
jgi:hypothetical protein